MEMADSGQQPTAGSEVDTLVNDIFDMISDMKIRKIAIGSLELYFNKLLHDLPSLPPEVSAKLQKTVQDSARSPDIVHAQTRFNVHTRRAPGRTWYIPCYSMVLI